MGWARARPIPAGVFERAGAGLRRTGPPAILRHASPTNKSVRTEPQLSPSG